MTRRERLIRIIDSFGGVRNDPWRYHRDNILAKRGLAAFSDEILAEMVSDMVSSHKRQQRYNRENRTRRAKVAP